MNQSSDQTTHPPIQRSRWSQSFEPVLLLIIRLVVGGVFLLFGVAKALEPREEFIASIQQYHLLPDTIIPFFATFLVYSEICLGLLFLLGLFTHYTRWLLSGLLLLFFIAIIQALSRGIALPDCGCSGSVVKLGDTPAEVLFRDGLLAVLLLVSWVRRRSDRYVLDRWFAHSE